MTDEYAHGDVVGMESARYEIARLQQVLAEKDRELRAYKSAADVDLRIGEQQCDEITQRLAEKDLEWKRRVGLDCGGHSCFYAIEKTGMRHNGRCSCDPKRTKQDHDVLYAQYRQLMDQAVRFAKYLQETIDVSDVGGLGMYEQVRAFLKEHS
jgi:hypothetical protein